MTCGFRPFRRTWLAASVGVMLLVLYAGQPLGAAAADDRAIERFRDLVNTYMELRMQAVEATGGLVPTSDPAKLTSERQALGADLRRRRSDAKAGDIFTPDIRREFRLLLAAVLEGKGGEDIRFRLNDDAPDVNAVPLDVNASYPAGLPFPTTPWPILARLPSLPPGLAYRFIGRDLILLDQPADLIVDYMRNALPKNTDA